MLTDRITPTSELIYEAVKKIPAGKVATYGQIATMAGNPKMCRAVGNALHKNPFQGSVPCHRVVNSQGKLADGFAFGGADIQAELLRSEGVEVINGYVDLEKYGIQLPFFRKSPGKAGPRGTTKSGRY